MRIKLAFAAMFVASHLLAAARTHAAMMPENTAVVVNADSWASVAIANEYIRLRHIPPQNVIYLSNLSSFDGMPVDEFRGKILTPALQTLESRGLSGQIDAMLYSSDFPTAIHVAGDIGKQQLPVVLTPEAAINGLTFLGPLTLAKDIRYLDFSANPYAMQRLPKANRPREESLSREEQKQVTALLEEFSKAVQRRQANPATRPSATSPASDAAEPALPPLDKDPATIAALTTLQDLRQRHPKSTEVSYNLACVLARIGEPEKAVSMLTIAVNCGWTDREYMLKDADLQSLHERHDFEALIERMPSSDKGLIEAQSQSATPLPPHFLISTMLACTSGRGNSVAEAIDYLQRSTAADGSRPSGTIYYEQNADVRSTTRQWGFQAAADRLKKLNVNAVVEKGTLPQNRTDVAGAMIGQAVFNWKDSRSSILPGAICEHLTSCGGMMGQDDGQSPLTEFLRHGAAGASGAVTEPYALQAKFPTPFIQLYYAQGYTLGEAFYQSVTGPYQLLIVGDALCRPWAPPVSLSLDGIEANATIHGRVNLSPHSTLPNARNLAGTATVYEIYIDGRRVTTLGPDGNFQWDTTQLPDGWHEVTATSEQRGVPLSRGRLSVPVYVANSDAANKFTVNGPKSPRIGWDQTIELTASFDRAREIHFEHNGRNIGLINGGSGTVRIDPRLVGQGPVTIQPVGIFGDGATQRVLGQPLELQIVPPAALPAIDGIAMGDLTPGFVVTPSGKSAVVIDKSQGDWLTKAGVAANDSFVIEAVINSPRTEVYQFQFEGRSKARRVLVDGQPQDWPRGKTWWFVPVHLAQGFHRIRIECDADTQPSLQIRFGGPGSQRLDAARFQHLATAATKPRRE